MPIELAITFEPSLKPDNRKALRREPVYDLSIIQWVIDVALTGTQGIGTFCSIDGGV